MPKNNITDKELLEGWKKEVWRKKAQESLREKYKNGRGPVHESKTPVEDPVKIEKAMRGIKYD